MIIAERERRVCNCQAFETVSYSSSSAIKMISSSTLGDRQDYKYYTVDTSSHTAYSILNITAHVPGLMACSQVWLFVLVSQCPKS